MTQSIDPIAASSYGQSFEQIDHELAALATMCKVDLLNSSNVERVLHNDATVCGTSNPAAFTKMRQLLMMHYAVRTRAAEELGEGPTQALINEVVERLRHRLGGAWEHPA